MHSAGDLGSPARLGRDWDAPQSSDPPLCLLLHAPESPPPPPSIPLSSPDSALLPLTEDGSPFCCSRMCCAWAASNCIHSSRRGSYCYRSGKAFGVIFAAASDASSSPHTGSDGPSGDDFTIDSGGDVAPSARHTPACSPTDTGKRKKSQTEHPACFSCGVSEPRGRHGWPQRQHQRLSGNSERDGR